MQLLKRVTTVQMQGIRVRANGRRRNVRSVARNNARTTALNRVGNNKRECPTVLSCRGGNAARYA